MNADQLQELREALPIIQRIKEAEGEPARVMVKFIIALPALLDMAEVGLRVSEEMQEATTPTQEGWIVGLIDAGLAQRWAKELKGEAL